MNAYHPSFDNTEIAFRHKSDKELKKARFLFSSMSNVALVKLGTLLTPMALRIGLPVRNLIRNTIFEQFVGGETLEQTAHVCDRLEKYDVQVILDYGVEGKEGENSFDKSCEEFIKVINYASTQHNIPFVSIKITAFARFTLLQKLDGLIEKKMLTRSSRYSTGWKDILQYIHNELTDAEKAEWNKVVQRMEKIMIAAFRTQISVLVDAEESWIQHPIDALTVQMMQQYNIERPVIYNTIQLYRTGRVDFLSQSLIEANDEHYILAIKIVRGAYMEKERKRAKKEGYPSPIQPDKESCDKDYNNAIEFAVNNIGSVALIVATHNEYSNLYATKLMVEKNIDPSHPHVHFSQLYGMSDNITFNLAAAGYSVSKYLPFGPINDVIPYLIRRAQENSSVSGQTSRELSLIKKEIKRRC